MFFCGVKYQVHPDLKLNYGGKMLDFSKPFRRTTMADAVAGVSKFDLSVFTGDSLESAKAAAVESLEGLGSKSESIQKVVIPNPKLFGRIGD